jgi:uncharacterized protein (DUF1697 family)
MAGRQVALLRGINVGRAKRVAMADLRRLVEALGGREVKTLLNSGNVAFTSRLAPTAFAARLETELIKRLGVSARVTALSAEELAAVVAGNPLREAAQDPSRFLVAFLRDPKDRAKLLSLAKQDWGKDALAVGQRVGYLWCKDGILASRLLEELGRALGDGVTTRNWSTVTKLHALAGQGD